MAAATATGTKGIVRQVIGPVLDVEFPAGKLPKIFNALRIEAKNSAGQDVALTAEVQQLLGDHRVRAVAMSGTDGLVRGMEALDTGAPITVPVGEATLGRIFNVLGEPVDEKGPIKTDLSAAIHREAPKLTELETKPKVFETDGLTVTSITLSSLIQRFILQELITTSSTIALTRHTQILKAELLLSMNHNRVCKKHSLSCQQ